jgi:hypothetical protein
MPNTVVLCILFRDLIGFISIRYVFSFPHRGVRRPIAGARRQVVSPPDKPQSNSSKDQGAEAPGEGNGQPLPER